MNIIIITLIIILISIIIRVIIILITPPNSADMSGVKRGKLAGLEGDMLKRVEPYSLTVKATCLEEFTLALVIDKVRGG